LTDLGDHDAPIFAITIGRRAHPSRMALHDHPIHTPRWRRVQTVTMYSTGARQT
jgi:hypothetical protein